MVAATGLRWILTLAFAMTVLYGAWRLVLPGAGFAERVDRALHASTGLCMTAMVWPWGMGWPPVPQIVLFSLGGLWFLSAAPFRAGDCSRARAILAVWPHVVMMGAMAWMVAAMDSARTMSGHEWPHGIHEVHGMEMSGDSGVAAMSLTGADARVTASLFAAVLTVIALTWLTRTPVRAGQGTEDRNRAGDSAASAHTNGPADTSTEGAPAHACDAAMALGMAVMFVLMV
ncbi:DUF5134 domain-containing protein [Streptomyces wuyuanensis]|uniref:DUF5134 domain-containing protein n=1 Tax=Streptomyces wuyuanensis TaxID=1196353 RepID=UPI003794C3E1